MNVLRLERWFLGGSKFGSIRKAMEFGRFFFFPALGEDNAAEVSFKAVDVVSHTWSGRGLAARRIGSSGGREGGREG